MHEAKMSVPVAPYVRMATSVLTELGADCLVISIMTAYNSVLSLLCLCSQLLTSFHLSPFGK